MESIDDDSYLLFELLQNPPNASQAITMIKKRMGNLSWQLSWSTEDMQGLIERCWRSVGMILALSVPPSLDAEQEELVFSIDDPREKLVHLINILNINKLIRNEQQLYIV